MSAMPAPDWREILLGLVTGGSLLAGVRWLWLRKPERLKAYAEARDTAAAASIKEAAAAQSPLSDAPLPC